MKLHKPVAALLIAATLSTAVPSSLATPYTVTAEAHPGRTDQYGGHHDYNNVSGLGSYHYHHGYGPHLHPNGVCPYENAAPAPADTAALLAQQQQEALLAQQQQEALLAQQQQAALLAQQQQAALLAQQQQEALLAQQQAALLAQQQQEALLAQQQAALLAQQQMASMIMQTQTVLKQAGFYNGEINGIWDLATQQALILFQTAYGLVADGTINNQIIALFNIH